MFAFPVANSICYVPCVCVCVLGVYADEIGFEAAEMLLRNIRHNGCVDEFLQDQVRYTPVTSL